MKRKHWLALGDAIRAQFPGNSPAAGNDSAVTVRAKLAAWESVRDAVADALESISARTFNRAKWIEYVMRD